MKKNKHFSPGPRYNDFTLTTETNRAGRDQSAYSGNLTRDSPSPEARKEKTTHITMATNVLIATLKETHLADSCQTPMRHHSIL